MKRTVYSAIIASVLIISVIGLFVASAPPEEPEPLAPPVIGEIYLMPHEPVGTDWVAFENGDQIWAYCTVIGADAGTVKLYYRYCNPMWSLPQPGTCAPYDNQTMTLVSGDLYKTRLIGPIAADGDTYVATQYIEYSVNAMSGADYAETAEEQYTVRWRPENMDVTANAEPLACCPGENVWVNGSAEYFYDNPDAWNTTFPVEYTNVTLNIDGADTLTKTNGTGNYSETIVAPMAPGLYLINTTVFNSTPSRNVTGYAPEVQVEVLDLANVTIELNTTSTMAGWLVRASGTATLSDGSAPEGYNVTAEIVETGDNWTTTTDAAGDYSVDVTAPAAVGTYTLNVTVENTTYGLVTYNETTFDVDDVPLPDLVVTSSDIVANGSLVEGLSHTINVTVWNKGIVTVTDALVNTSINGVWYNSTNVSVATGGSTEIEIDWLPDSGVKNISVSVDPLDNIEEKYEVNNTAYKIVEILVDTDGDDIPDSTDTDDDGDDYLDIWEEILGTDPKDGTDMPTDTDGDGLPDGNATNSETWMDTDDDADGTPDASDAFPTDPDEDSDFDGDGIGDNADTDDDNDGYPDVMDPEPHDTDNDGLPNDLDLDDDADGITDTQDTYPLDTDNDGQNNEADTDDDGDSLLDTMEDADWDGVWDVGNETNYLDPDTDGDGVNDNTDYDPLDPDVTEEPSSGSSLTLPIAVAVIVVVVIVILAYLFVQGKQGKGKDGEEVAEDAAQGGESVLRK